MRSGRSSTSRCPRRRGTFNIAADGVITLTQAIRRAGRIELPVPPAWSQPITGVFADVRSARLRSSQMDYLDLWPRPDNTRMRTRPFEPRFTTSETLEGLHRARRLRHGRQSESLARVGATHRVHRTPVAIATGVTPVRPEGARGM